MARKEYLLPPSKDQATRKRQLLRVAEFFGLKAKCHDAKKARSLGAKIVVIEGDDLERVNPAVAFGLGDDPNPN
ncbi:MAG: hypothetical protein M3178_04340 [Pseudomonadota bacterium]|nr:hypothetical protein [Pseudomonadota bacterium]